MPPVRSTSPSPPLDERPHSPSRRALTFGLGAPLLLVTLGTLVLELALTRLFSVVLFYHYAFFVISIALLGLACGGLLARFHRLDLSSAHDRRQMVRACVFAALTLLPILYLALRTNIWLVTSWQAVSQLSVLYVVCTLPFVIVGYVIAATLTYGAREVATLYFYDLLGASLGCLAFVPLMNWLGGPGAVLAAGLLWCLAGMTWALGSTGRRGIGEAVVGVGLLASLLIINDQWNVFDVHYLRGAPRKDEVFAKWNSFSRVSVHQQETGRYWIEIDGGAGTAISDVDMEGPTGAWLKSTLGITGPQVAFALSDSPRSLVIGPGGGPDVAHALAAGGHVTAVEINPLIARDVMLERFREVNHGLYARPDVQLVIEDGRTFVQRTQEEYDVILLSQVDTWASSASGSYALTENYLYTVEAVEAYLERLTPGGILSISRWEFTPARETLRMVAVVMEALRRLDVPNPEQNIVVLMENLDSSGEVQWGTVLVRPTPFTPTQLQELAEPPAEARFRIAYAPGTGLGEEPFAELITTDDPEAFFDGYPFNVRPVTDDNPFFFFTGRWSGFFGSLLDSGTGGDAVSLRAQFLLLALFALALGAVLLFLIGPLLLSRGTFAPTPRVVPFLLFASCLGLAYILVEIALIQRFVVFLGQPVYSLTVVIFSLLVSSSLGSMVSGRFPEDELPNRARWAIAAVVVLLLLYAWLIPGLTENAQGLPRTTKALIAAGAILPLGFLMGVPFPSGVRLTAREHPEAVEWFWALNAAATVLGSVGAILFFVVVGIARTILLASLIYAAAAMLVGWMGRPPPAAIGSA